PLGAIQPTKAFSCKVRPELMVDKKMDNGLTTNIINKTYPIIFGLKICKIVSICSDAANIIKMVEISKTEIFSLKLRKSFNELIPILLKVRPIAVTDSKPVP